MKRVTNTCCQQNEDKHTQKHPHFKWFKQLLSKKLDKNMTYGCATCEVHIFQVHFSSDFPQGTDQTSRSNAGTPASRSEGPGLKFQPPNTGYRGFPRLFRKISSHCLTLDQNHFLPYNFQLTVAYRTVARKRPRDKRVFNSGCWVTVQTDTNKTEERCFPRGPCWDVISRRSQWSELVGEWMSKITAKVRLLWAVAVTSW
jgi:hypothetical protein